MDLLGHIFGGSLMAGVPGPTDDYWYQPIGTLTASGIRVDETGAQKLSAWYRGRDILATVLAMLPFPVLQVLPDDGGSTSAPDHPLYDVLHDKPNDAQDSFQWRREQMFDIIDHGWAYNWIVPGSRGFAHQLVPIEPTLVTPKQQATTLANGATIAGRYLFDIRNPTTNVTKTFTQDDIFYLRGASGKGILEYARTSLGTALATESYAANIFSNGTLNGGVIENPGVLKPDAGARMAKSFVTKVGEWHFPKILEQGSKWIANQLTPENAQMLLSRKYTVDDIARWLGVPRLMLENNDPSFGNAEQFTQNFIDFNMGGWLALWEFAVSDQLILAPQKYFAQFKRQAFVRGNFKDRIDGLVLAAGGPIMSPDEARSVEDLPKLGGKNGELRENQNVTGKPVAASPDASAPLPKRTSQPAKAQAIVVESASRLLSKEIAEIQKLAVRHAIDQDAFAEAVTDFYAAHVARVSGWLQMSTADAERYCAGQAAQVVAADWIAALAQWKTADYATGLAALALDEAA